MRVRNYRADGTPWWNELVLCPVHDSAGQLTHYIGVQNDITARVEAEQTVLHLAIPRPADRAAQPHPARDNARAIAARAAEQLLHALQEPFHLDDVKIYVGASIGISVDVGTALHADDLLRDADAAMYTAKRRGGMQHHTG